MDAKSWRIIWTELKRALGAGEALRPDVQNAVATGSERPAQLHLEGMAREIVDENAHSFIHSRSLLDGLTEISNWSRRTAEPGGRLT